MLMKGFAISSHSPAETSDPASAPPPLGLIREEEEPTRTKHTEEGNMEDRWKKIWMELAFLFASRASGCSRGFVGAFVIDPRNNPVSAGYNGGPRGAIGRLCGGEFCERERAQVESGTQTEIGCHHAEANALMNAAHRGISVAGCAMIVTTSPCLSCARLIHHAGIREVVTLANYDARGVAYLRNVGVEVSVIRLSEP